MFSAIRQGLLEKFGDTGQKKLVLTDFELAAIDTIGDVFNEYTVKGCTFHFRQALMRKVSELGLRGTYISGVPVVQDWIRKIMGLMLLPEVFVIYAWQKLRNPPILESAELKTQLAAFSSYFEKTWMNGSFTIRLWNHYDNVGPRTTNLAEGWHNSLNYSLGMPHPSASNFLHWLQKCQYEVQFREI